MLRKFRIPLALAACLLIIYAFAGFVLAPRWVTQAYGEFVTGRLGKRPALAAVHVNPFALSLEARGLAIREPDGTLLVGCERLYVNLSLASLFTRAVVIEAIEIDKPTVAAILRADHGLNLDGLVPAPDPHAPAPVANAPLPAVRVAALKISGGEVSFEDRGSAPPLRAVFVPINISLHDFSTQPGTDNAYTVNAVGPWGTRLAWTGTLQMQPFTAAGRFTIDNLAGTTIGKYAGDFMPFDVPAGQLQFATHYRLASQAQGLEAVVTLDTLDGTGLELRSRGAEASEVKLAQLAIRAASFDLAGRSADLGTIEIGGADITAFLDRSGLNLARLAGTASTARPPAAPSTATAAPKAAPWTIGLPRLVVSNAAVHLEDRTTPVPARLELSQLAITATGYSSKPGTEVDVNLQSTVGTAATLAMDLKAKPDVRSVRGSVKLSGFELTSLAPYLADLVRLDLRGGLLDVSGEYRAAAGAAGAAPVVGFDGEAAVRALDTTDRLEQKDFIKWERLRASGIHYRSPPGSLPASLAVKQVDFDAPYVDLVIAANGTTNISDVLGKAQATGAVADAGTAATSSAVPAAPAAPGMAIDIGRVTLHDGSANFEDFSVKPNFGTGIQALAGTITGLSSKADSRAVVALDGAVDKYAPVKVSGEVNYLAAQSYTDIKASFRNMELTSLNPYSGKFAGYAITRGKLSADFSYLVRDRKLDAQHKILLTQLQLGERVESPDAIGLPLRLVVALLKDRDGNIELDLPVTGDLDDPHFRVGPIIWKMFVNLCAKIVTSPFALLGRLAGGGPDLNFIDFAPGAGELDPAMGERLVGLRKALMARPGLELEIAPASNAALDGEALRSVGWQQELDRLVPLAQRADRKRYLKALGRRYAEVTGEQAAVLLAPAPADGSQPKPSPEAALEDSIARLESALRARVAVSAADLEALALARARVIQDALLKSGEIDPLRVFIVAPLPAAAEAGKVRVELALRR